mmetsp:Transcript_103253/g.301179  ORF Transcript_103253/g.301179 Transcript_103253/m.301179 type:complete len:565 (+) Transcript_103253:66-1760(+)
MSADGVPNSHVQRIALLGGRGDALCFESQDSSLPTIYTEQLELDDTPHTDSELVGGERARAWRCGHHGPELRSRIKAFIEYLAHGNADNDNDNDEDEMPGSVKKRTGPGQRGRVSCKQRRKLWLKRLAHAKRWMLHRGRVVTLVGTCLVTVGLFLRHRRPHDMLDTGAQVYYAKYTPAIAGSEFPCLDFTSLLNDANYSDHFGVIEQTFGKYGLGILCVSGNASFQQAVRRIRRNFMPMAHPLTKLKGDARSQLYDPDAPLTNGLSRGAEVTDRAKSTFFYHPLTDAPAEYLSRDVERIPAFHNPNRFPSEDDIPGFKEEARKTAQFMESVGQPLARWLDRWLEERVPGYKQGLVESAVRLEPSSNHKCAVFCFHPFEDMLQFSASKGMWAAPSVDIAMLTGTVPGVFLDKHGELADRPDVQTGIYISDRTGLSHKIEVPNGIGEVLLFWVGESLEIVSGGALRATPNYVKGPALPDPDGVSFVWFVMFMQPHAHEELPTPSGISLETIANLSADNHLPPEWPSLQWRIRKLRQEDKLSVGQPLTFGLHGNITFSNLAANRSEL